MVVFDGALYDRVVGNGQSAADFVLGAYLRRGAEALAELRGAYALAIWDGADGSVLCARDQAGTHPLFYSDAGEELLVSSSTEALLRHPSVPRRLNRTALADHLCHGYPQALDETFYAAIKRLPPGHALRQDAAGRQTYRYWDPAPPGELVQWATEDELERLEELVRRAVERCLGLGPAGIYLSGGADSATVAAFAAAGSRTRRLPAPLALSLLFPHPECNEEAVQRAVAAQLGLPQVVASFDEAVGAGRLLAAALELSSRWPSPLLNLFEPGFQHLGAEARRRGCEVVLTGGGGDEWFALSPGHAQEFLRSFDLAGLYRLWEARRRYLPAPALSVLRGLVWRGGLRALLREAAMRRAPRALGAYRRRGGAEWIPRWIASDRGLRHELYERAEALAGEPLLGDRYLLEKSLTLDHPLEAIGMEETHAAGERLGIRVLQPLRDPDLVDLLYRTPPKLLIRGGREKAPMRDLLASRLPAFGGEWPKTVFMDGFLSSVMLEQGPEAWRWLGGVPALTELGVVEPKRLRVFVERCLSGQGAWHELMRVWTILSTEAWLRPRL